MFISENVQNFPANVTIYISRNRFFFCYSSLFLKYYQHQRISQHSPAALLFQSGMAQTSYEFPFISSSFLISLRKKCHTSQVEQISLTSNGIVVEKCIGDGFIIVCAPWLKKLIYDAWVHTYPNNGVLLQLFRENEEKNKRAKQKFRKNISLNKKKKK